MRSSQHRIVFLAAITARYEAIFCGVSEHDPMKAKSMFRLCQDNIVFVQLGNDCGDDLDHLPVTYCRRHTGTACLKAHAEALRQEWADELVKELRVGSLFNHGT